MTCCLVETVLLHAVHLSAIREQFVNIERYVNTQKKAKKTMPNQKKKTMPNQ